MALSSGTHWAGPLLGSDKTGGGIFDDVPFKEWSELRSRWKLRLEDFDEDMASIAVANQIGWTETAVGVAAGRTMVVDKENGFLNVDADTVANEGTNAQLLGTPSQVTYTNTNHKSIGPITSTTTLMANRSLLFECRINFLQAVGTAWTNKLVIGWMTTDTALMGAVGGSLIGTIATGGGLFFHIMPAGVVSFGTQKAAFGTLAEVNTSVSVGTLSTTYLPANWLTLGFKAVWGPDPTATNNGYTDFYINNIFRGRVAGQNPMTSTQTYAVTYELINGAAAAPQVDMAIDYILTGITRPGYVGA